MRGHATRGVALALSLGLVACLVCGFFVWFGLLVFLVFSWPGGPHPRRAGSVTHPRSHAIFHGKLGAVYLSFFLFYSLGGFFFFLGLQIVWSTIP